MSEGTIQKPNLLQALESLIDAKVNQVHTAMPAVIVSYDYTTTKADVQPCISKQYLDKTINKLPLISDVPVFQIRGANAGLTIPVLADDYCLLIFCETSIDKWVNDGEISAPSDNRKYDLSSAIALHGITPAVTAALADNNEDVKLSLGNTKVIIKSNGDVEIDASGSNVKINCTQLNVNNGNLTVD